MKKTEVDEVWLTLPLPSGLPIFIASHDLVNGTHDPVNGNNDPVNGDNDPVNGDNDPVNGDNDPVNGNNDPVNGNNDPVNGNNDPVNGTVNASSYSGKMPSTYKSILETIARNPTIKTQQLCEELNISESTLKRAKRILKKEGLLIREGSDKTGRWKVNIDHNKN